MNTTSRFHTCLWAGILILALLGAACFPAVAASDVAGAPGPDAKEEDLVAELLAINLDIMKLRQDREAQQEKLATIRASIEKQRADLVSTRADLAEARARLGVWLCDHYEHGRWAHLEFLLGTRDFGDFFNRLEMLQILIEYESGLYNEVQRLNERIKTELAGLEALQTEARYKEDQIRRQLAAIERTKTKRVAFLDQIRRESSALADRITKIEQQWQASLRPLHNVLSQLDILLVREIKPDRVSFEGTGIRLEVGAEAVNKALRSVGGQPGDSLAVSLARDAVTIRGHSAADGSQFVLTGRLEPRERGTAVSLQPRSLTVNGDRLDPTLLPALNRDGGLSFSLGREYCFFSVREIRHVPDKVVIILRRG